jgi:inhibitor of cysteine peptidase
MAAFGQTAAVAVLLVLLGAMSPPALVCAAEVVTVTDADNGKAVDVAVGETLVLRLSATAGTGYSWNVIAIDDKQLAREGDATFEPAKAPMPGAAGFEVLRFKAKSRGRSLLELHYVRPWEKDAAPARTFRLTVLVE